MGLTWNPLALPGLLAFPLTAALAFFIYTARPHRAQNRWLAAFLVLWGAGSFFTWGLRLLLTEPGDAYAAGGMLYPLVPFLIFFYCQFLSTLETPLARPFRKWPVRALLLAYVALVETLWFARPETFVAGVAPFPHLDAWSLVPTSSGFLLVFLAGDLALLYGLAVAISALRHATTSVERRQARAYAWAFGLHDAVLAVWTLSLLTFPGIAWYDSSFWGNRLLFVVTPINQSMLAVLLALGILRTQLFDVDVRLKIGLRQTTVAAVFIAVFFVVSEGTAALLSERLGPAIGILVAGLLLFALAPLQRLAERLSEAALPDARPLDQMGDPERIALYREMAESAWADGQLSRKERVFLEGLRGRLGLTPEQAATVEDEVTRAPTTDRVPRTRAVARPR